MTAGASDESQAGFGPFEPLQVLTDLQRQGIRAATEVAVRLTSMLDGPHRESNGRGDRGPMYSVADTNGDHQDDGETLGELRATVTRAVDTYANLLERTFDAYFDLIDERTRPTGPRLSNGTTDGVYIELHAGEQGRAELWLENPTAEPGPTMTPQATTLSNGTGFSISATSIAFEPSIVDAVAPGTAENVAMIIDTKLDLPVGHYYGHVLVREQPGMALSVAVRIGPPAARETDLS